ncbi:MAG: ABC transporter permease [Sphingomonadales bacterium]|nr:ABC transporter permease [Sphingomonadales bacterium]
MMREVMTRYGRHNIGFFWLFAEPMIFTLGVTGLWTLAGMSHGSQLPITAFALTGYSTVLLWRNMPARCILAISANLPLMYHRNVRVIDILLSRIGLEVCGASMSFIILTLIFVGGEWIKPPEDVLGIVAAWLMTAWFGAALALFLGSMSERTELIDKIWHPASYLMFPLSGAAFLVDSLPRGLQAFVLWIPTVHCTELLRASFFGTIIVPHYDLSYLFAFNAVLTILGLAAERRVSREIVLE